jgi:uridine kinase
MLEDVLRIEDKHIKAAEDLYKLVTEKRKSKYIIAVSGESGSGKSVLSYSISKILNENNIPTKIIHVDNFYNTLPLERNRIRKEKGIENSVGIHEYRWKKIDEVAIAFHTNAKVSTPCVDLLNQRVDTLTTDFSEIEILIFEGLYAINYDKSDLKIFIDLTYHQTKEAQIFRGKEKIDKFRFQVLEAEHKAVSSLAPKANIIIDKDFKLCLKRI